MAGLTATLGSRSASLGRIVLGQAPPFVPSETAAFLPQIVVEFSPSTGPMGAAVWVDISRYATGVTTARGRQYELDRVEAGIMTVTLRDDDRRFDPMNTDGPYAGQLVPGKRIRVLAIWDGVAYPIFMGYVETWNLPMWQIGQMVTTVNVADGFSLLANMDISETYPEQRTDERISAILGDAGWSTGQAWLLEDPVYGILGTTTIAGPVGAQSLSAGQTTVQAVTLVNVPALTHIQLMAQAENGLVFIAPDGTVTFRSRHQLLYDTEIDATFGTDPNAGELPYTNALIDATGAKIYNDVHVTRIGGTEQVTTDATSIAAYFGRSYSLTSLPLTTDTEALSYANFVLSRYKDFHVRLTALVVESRMNPAGLWPQTLARDLTDRLRVRYQPYLGSVLDETVRIERVAHEFSTERGVWRTVWALSSVPDFGGDAGADPWILEVNGYLGTDTVPVY